MRTGCILRDRRKLILVLVCAQIMISTGETRSEEFYHDFRQGTASQPLLVLTGPAVVQTIRSDSRGLRITLSEKRPKLDPVGVRTQLVVHGDFEITATCELLKADKPPKGFGAGARLYARFNSPNLDVFSLSRVVRQNEGECFLAYHVHKKEDGKQSQHFQAVETSSPNGRLRLVRTGTKLSMQVAENQQVFRELYAADIGTSDLVDLSLSATTGGERCGVDVRWGELKIRADRLPSQVSLAAQTTSVWWMGAIIGAVILVVVAVVIGYRIRYRLQ